MKKRLLITIVLILFLTGCSCEYDLTIENDIFKEVVKFGSNDTSEVSNFSMNWKIPTNKEEYEFGLDEEANPEYSSKLYDYNLNGNVLTFNHDFTMNAYIDSSAVSLCYDMLSVTERGDDLIISTGKENMCFTNYPTLDSLRVKIKVDGQVVSNNADSVNGNTYIWNFRKNNALDKGINLVVREVNNANEGSSSNNSNNNNNSVTRKDDYSFYIFFGILLIVMLSVYFIVNKFKKNKDVMDD